MPEKNQNTSVTYESGGFPDGRKLKSGGPRSGRQPARGERKTARLGISSNVGPQRDYVNELSNSTELGIPTKGEVRRREAKKYGWTYTPMESDDELDWYEHQKRRNIDRDTVP